MEAAHGTEVEPFLTLYARQEADALKDQGNTAFKAKDYSEALRAWQRGETGYPLVDACMRSIGLDSKWYVGVFPPPSCSATGQSGERRP